jgi:hypothetical protein
MIGEDEKISVPQMLSAWLPMKKSMKNSMLPFAVDIFLLKNANGSIRRRAMILSNKTAAVMYQLATMGVLKSASMLCPVSGVTGGCK